MQTQVYETSFRFHVNLNTDSFGAYVCLMNGSTITNKCARGASVEECIARLFAEPAFRLTPHTADAACAPAGEGETDTRGAADV
jgi:hypothetical protein